MNIIKKSAVLLSALFLCGCTDMLEELGFSEATIDEQQFHYEESAVSYEAPVSYAGQTHDISADTSEEYDELYTGIVESLKNMEMSSEYNSEISVDDIESRIELIEQTYPEFFWISGYTVTNSGGESIVELDVLNNYSDTELESMLNEIVAVGDDIINQIPPYADTYTQVLFVHDYIVNHTSYDSDSALLNKKGIYSTIYGCLVQGKAVCQGYADAFQYIMNRLGIECGICSGITSQGSHAWNYVKIDGKYYWLDVTWDDPVSQDNSSEKLLHTYFLVDDERIFRTRFIDGKQVFVPNCFSMDNNYFVRNNTYLSYYDEDKLSQIFAGFSENSEIEIMFADRSSYNETVQKLFTDGDIWNFISAEELKYTTDDIMNVLTVSVN